MEVLNSDLVYDDDVDHWSNVDYTHDPAFAPPLMRLWEFGRVDPKLEEPNVALMAGQMAIGAFFVTILFASLVLATLGTWPGHPGGKLYPLYVPEHYGKRNSQHLSDPYSFTHIGHGILSYYIFCGLDNESAPVFGFEKKRPFGDPDRYDLRGQAFKNTGLVATLIAALMFEHLENSETVINMFRQNTGTSTEYRGDSSVNVFGDLLSAAIGYNFARFSNVVLEWPELPLTVFFFSEFVSAISIRDNMALIISQFIYPLEWIKQWQADIIPATRLVGDGDEVITGYWANKYVPKQSSQYM